MSITFVRLADSLFRIKLSNANFKFRAQNTDVMQDYTCMLGTEPQEKLQVSRNCLKQIKLTLHASFDPNPEAFTPTDAIARA